MPTPVLNHDLRLRPVPEPLQTQTLVAELPVERLVHAVLPRLARVDVRRIDVRCRQPFEHGFRHELGAVVRAQVPRRAMLADQLRQHLNDPAGADAAGNVDRERRRGMLVDDRQALQLLAVGAGVVHEVVRPNMVLRSRRLRSRPRVQDFLCWGPPSFLG